MYSRTAVLVSASKGSYGYAHSINPNEDGITETESHGYLEFDNVPLLIQGRRRARAYNIISFKRCQNSGETVLVGSTGSGKSSPSTF